MLSLDVCHALPCVLARRDEERIGCNPPVDMTIIKSCSSQKCVNFIMVADSTVGFHRNCRVLRGLSMSLLVSEISREIDDYLWVCRLPLRLLDFGPVSKEKYHKSWA